MMADIKLSFVNNQQFMRHQKTSSASQQQACIDFNVSFVFQNLCVFIFTLQVKPSSQAETQPAG